MRPSRLVLALSLATLAAPAALSAHPSGPAAPGSDKDKAPEKSAKGPKGTNYLLHACVTGDATAQAVALKVLGGNRHMRDALAGAPELEAALAPSTFVRLVGKARAAGATGKASGIGTFDDLNVGDRVIVRFRAARGTAGTALPAAWRVIDRGPTSSCAVPASPPPADAPPPAETPPGTPPTTL